MEPFKWLSNSKTHASCLPAKHKTIPAIIYHQIILLWVRFYCELATVLMMKLTGRWEDEEWIEMIANDIIVYT